jgi:hypothetical protein
VRSGRKAWLNCAFIGSAALIKWTLCRQYYLYLIERLWTLMRKNVTHNKYYAAFKDCSAAISKFLYYDINQLTDVLPQRLKIIFTFLSPFFCKRLSRCVYTARALKHWFLRF